MVLPQSLAKLSTLIVEKLETGQAKLTRLNTEVFWNLYDEFLAVEKRLRMTMKSWPCLVRPIPHVNGCRPSQGLGHCVVV